MTGNTISFFRNISTQGNIVFAPATTLPGSLAGNGYFKLADIDGDGKADIVGFSGNNLVVYRNTGAPGQPAFDGGHTFLSGSGPTRLALGDLDGDGKPDVVVTNSIDGNIAVFRNTSSSGTVNFDAAVNYVTTDATYTFASPGNVFIADLDGDQRPEIIVADDILYRVTVFQNRLGLSPAPKITSFSPTSATAGQPVGIKGTNFTGTLYVTFGGVPASSFNVVTSDSIVAIPAAGATGNLAVTTRGGSDTAHGFIYAPEPAPVVTGFTPASAGANDTIRVSGAHFTTAQSLRLGNVPVSSFTLAGDTLLIGVVGAGATGYVAVTTRAGADSVAGFTYIQKKPFVYSFTPSSAKTGDTILVRGAGFAAATLVTLGGVNNYFHILNDSALYVVVGAFGTTGSIGVVNPFGSASLAGFTWIEPAPAISYFYPTSGYQGDTVVVTGRYLSGTTKVSFGGTNASGFNVWNDSTLTAVVGAGTTGSVGLTTGQGTVSFGTFTYLGPSDSTKPPPPDTTNPSNPPPPDTTSTAHQFKLLSFNASLAAGQALLQWRTQYDKGILYYFVQEGADSTSLTEIATVTSKRADTASYVYTDVRMRNGTIWYRLMMEDTSSLITYSSAVPVQFVATQSTGIYPNPAVGIITALVPNSTIPSQFELVDANGRVLMVIPVNANTAQVQVNVAGLTPGTYRLAWSNGNSRLTKTILILK